MTASWRKRDLFSFFLLPAPDARPNLTASFQNTWSRVTFWATDRRAVFLLLDEGQHAGEDARAHHQVLLLLHVPLEDPQHHRQQDAPRLCRVKKGTCDGAHEDTLGSEHKHKQRQSTHKGKSFGLFLFL